MLKSGITIRELTESAMIRTRLYGAVCAFAGLFLSLFVTQIHANTFIVDDFNVATTSRVSLHF
jgi:hypothetical protein